MQKNVRPSTVKRLSVTNDEQAGSVSYYEWANRSMQTGSQVRIASASQPGPIRRFFRRIARQ